LVDGSIVTTDTGEGRMYLELTPTLRLRSHDNYQVVLEHYRDSRPIKKSDPVYVDWFFEGYFPCENFLTGAAKAATDTHRKWGRKFNRPQAVEEAIQRYWNIWQHFNTYTDKNKIAAFVKEAKEYERAKKSNRSGLGNDVQSCA